MVSNQTYLSKMGPLVQTISGIGSFQRKIAIMYYNGIYIAILKLLLIHFIPYGDLDAGFWRVRAGYEG